MKNKINGFDPSLIKLVYKLQADANKYSAPWWFRISHGGKGLFAVYTVFTALTVIINSIILTNYSWRIDTLSGSENAKLRAAYLTVSRAFIIGTLLLVAGYILFIIARKISNNVKKPLIFSWTATAVNIIGSFILSVTAYNVLLGRNIDDYAESVEASTPLRLYFEFFVLHVLPLVVVTICTLMFLISFIKNYKEICRIYSAESENAYKIFTEEHPKYSEKEWEEYLVNYAEERMDDNENLQ